MLSERPTFTTLPRLKLTAADELRGLLVLTGLIVKRTKLDTQIIAPPHQVKPHDEFPQSPLWLFAKPLPKLVALEEEAGVIWVGAERAIVSRASFGRLLE